MKALSAKEDEYGFGGSIDAACAEPAGIAKHGKPVVVVMAVEVYEQLTGDKATGMAEDKAIPMNRKNPTSRGRNKK